MPKRNEYPVTGAFPLAQLEGLYERARKQLTGCQAMKVPQKQAIDLTEQRALPSLDGLAGIHFTTIRVQGFVLAAGLQPGLLADILRPFPEKLPSVRLELLGQLQAPRGSRWRDSNWVGCGRVYGHPTFHTWLPMLLQHLDPAGRDPVLRRVIAAGDLPVKLVHNRARIEYETASGGQPHVGYADRHGALSLSCRTEGDTPERQVERVQAVLTELQLQPQVYVWSLLEVGGKRDCLETYRTVQSLNLPGERFRVDLGVRLTELPGVESLQRLAGLMTGRKEFQTVLCRFPVHVAPKKLGKVMIRTSKAGHRVSLFLPETDDAGRAAVADKLGLTLATT